MTIIKRKEAIQQGLVSYFTGKPCPKGHIAERNIKAKRCNVCLYEQHRNWVGRNKEWKIDYDKNYREENKIAISEKTKQRNKRNRTQRTEYMRKWREANRGRNRAIDAKRRAAKVLATPSWSQSEEIIKFYEGCPKGYEVDHIYPLISDKVCGLHVIANLQYLTSYENAAKGNRI